ncbi:MAG: hypothetical protein H7Y86_02570 [Rhizobacter sp.]|nr:hypothetical protein [Ferruginibacter sp.]
MKPLAVYHEHPDWFKPLFAELDERDIAYERLNPAAHSFNVEDISIKYALFFNRMSPSAYLRNGEQGTFFTLSYLKHLELHGTKTINGYKAFTYETSKAMQLSLIKKLGYGYPKTIVVNHSSQLLAAAAALRFPIVVKANIGGSGAGITKYNELATLQADIEAAVIDFGIDKTALVQEFVPARGGFITRVETLDGKYLYGINVYTNGENFNLCPADICQTNDGKELLRNACAVDAPKNGLTVEAYTPPEPIIKAIEAIVQAAGIDVGGIEYMTDDRDGSIVYYDVNALSNFVADAVNVIGFNPHEKLVDYLEEKIHAGVESSNSIHA